MTFLIACIKCPNLPLIKWYIFMLFIREDDVLLFMNNMLFFSCFQALNKVRKISVGSRRAFPIPTKSITPPTSTIHSIMIRNCQIISASGVQWCFQAPFSTVCCIAKILSDQGLYLE